MTRSSNSFFAGQADVLMGGGAANFLPQAACRVQAQGRRRLCRQIPRRRLLGCDDKTELDAAERQIRHAPIAGSVRTGKYGRRAGPQISSRGGGVKKFPDQPDLTEQVQTALNILSKNDAGFFLMVESGMIDKYAHLLDMERAVYDTIMLDNAVGLARKWAQARGDDTLILVLADHNHPNSLVGTISDDMSTTPNVPLRERVGVYEKAGFPNYPAPDADGYPSRVDVSRRLAIFSASLPDHYETFRPKLDNPNEPTVKGDEAGTFKANDKYKDVPGVVLRFGNLPAMMGASVHSGEDVILTGTGPGSERIHGSMDNTDVFRDHGGRTRPRRPRANSFARAVPARQESDGAANISLTQLRNIRICRSRRLGSFSDFDMMMAPSTTQDSISATSSRSTGSRGG
jgi:alkaline phosphatase